MASSWPGSQSMITGVGMAQHVGGLRVQTLSCRSPPSFSAPFSPRPPPATTGDAESVTTGSAVVTGTVNPGGEATTYQFEYGTTSSYGLTTPQQDAGSGTDRVGVRVDALRPDRRTPRTTTASWRPTPSGQSARRRSLVRTASPAAAPSISSRSATGVTASGATLGANVNPRSLATTVRFEYGMSTSYGTATPEQAIGAGTSAVAVSAAIAGLSRARGTTTAPSPRARRASRAAATARSPPRRRRPAWPSRPRRSARSGARA